MAETDLIKLYSQRILKLAADIPRTELLDHADGVAKKRSPLCGSTVTVSVVLDGDRVVNFGQDVKACALGQASASILSSNVIGLSEDTIRKGRDQLFALLTQDGPLPDAPFEDLEVLASAKDYKNRHASIMLGFEATLAAIEDAQKKAAQS